MNKLILAVPFILSGLVGCTTFGPFGDRSGYLSDQAVLQRASAGPLEPTRAQIITDNDEAFRSKLQMIEGARQSIDLMYYIYDDDYSSSVLTQALIDAARRGVQVRLLVDYSTNYRRLDWFSMMELQGNAGQGSLRVRFYNRPTRNIVQDAVYLTMGCGKDSPTARRPGQCSAEKFAAIDRLFAEERIDGQPVGAHNISNLNIGNSGLFLSGLYAKRPDVIALAVQQGQDIEVEKISPQQPVETSPEERQKLKKLAGVYWDSKTAPAFQRLVAKAQLYFALSVYGEKLGPIWDTFTGLLPTEKPLTEAARQDWNHLTDFLHHKLLLVDGNRLQAGGRNVEDSYHMRPNPLAKKYLFMDTDTDIYLELKDGGNEVAQAFDALWNFDTMVATLAEVRQHAPNDFVANLDVYRDATQRCRSVTAPAQREACVDQQFKQRFKDLALRLADNTKQMELNTQTYRSEYARKAARSKGIPTFTVDNKALYAYLENLPFDKSLSPSERRRIYGAEVGQEARSGKYIHDVWLRSLPGLCQRASKENPQRVILHNAYFFPPANMTYALSQMANGAYDCSNVTVTVLTNSIETTDLNVVNLLARHSLKAFTEFYQQQSDPARRAQFEYYEYRPGKGKTSQSLHTKVALLGDDVLVGSANADVRSFMMDSNNAVFVRGADQFRQEYAGYVQGILKDPRKSRKINDELANTPRETLVKKDVAAFRKLLAKYGVDQHLNPTQRRTAEQLFVQMLDASYSLTKASIMRDKAEAGQPVAREPSPEQRQQQQRFNELFKPI
jgi:putative cardiolipin synthase